MGLSRSGRSCRHALLSLEGNHSPLALGKEGAQWKLGGGKAGQSPSAPLWGGDLMPLAMAVCAEHGCECCGLTPPL